MKYRSLRIAVTIALLVPTCFGRVLAPGGPGIDAQWATAAKQAVGTSANLGSKVWFTLAQGVMTEVYYPDVTVANVQMLQFVVVNPKTKKVETERDDAVHRLKVLRADSLSFQQINIAKSGDWKITKTYSTNPRVLAAVLIDVRFESKSKLLNLYYYFDPSIANSGMGDSAFATAGKIVAFDGEIYASLLFSGGASEQTNNVSGPGDGLDQLRTFGEVRNLSRAANNGNVVQVGKVSTPSRFTAVLSFADTEAGSFVLGAISKLEGFTKALADYETGWAEYVKTLPRVDPKYQVQFNMAAMQLKAHEDKTRRGANIASLSIPWGGGVNANENNVGGYHLVWSRDLYQVATAYMGLGDEAAAIRALDFLFNVQQRPDGSFPQNSWLDGKPYWNSLQMDEIAYPLILAYQLRRYDRATYDHVRRAADFIVKDGPATPQERWEEEAGYSPSTIAAEIAGLVCAADIAKRNGDEKSAATWLKTADEWQAKIEKWTATTTGKYGDGNYYLRITQNGKPDAGDKIEINNGAGFFDEREIVDAGFLELVRLGIKPPDDPLIVKSLKVIDSLIKVDTPSGAAFYRYNHDGYGEMDDGRRWNWDGKYTGKGRLWALLSGERGQYEIAECVTRNADLPARKRCMSQAAQRLDAMLGFANEGMMIPEQIWDKKDSPTVDAQFVPKLTFGEGTGSATPLAWSMAQFIRLAVNLKAGRNFDTPNIVYQRYVR